MHFCHITGGCLLTSTSVAFYTLHYGSISRGVTRGARGAQFHGRRITLGRWNTAGGAEWLWGRQKVPTMSQALSSIQYICFRKKNLRFKHGVAKLASCPGDHPVPSPRGGFCGLSPPDKAPSPPNWNMKHYESMEFLSIFSVKPPATNAKPPRRNAKSPYWKLSGGGSGAIYPRYAHVSQEISSVKKLIHSLLCCKTTMQTNCGLTNRTGNSPENGFSFSFWRLAKSCVSYKFSILHSYFYCCLSFSFQGGHQALKK